MNGDDNIPRNPDGLYVEAESVSVFVNVLVGAIVVLLVIVLVIVTMMIRWCVIRTIVRICKNLYVPVVVTLMSQNVTTVT